MSRILYRQVAKDARKTETLRKKLCLPDDLCALAVQFFPVPVCPGQRFMILLFR